MRLVFWQSILSPHQASYIRSLAARPGWQVTVVVQNPITPHREAMGWRAPNMGQAEVLISSEGNVAELLAEYSGRGAIHLLEGIRGCDLATRALSFLTKRSEHVGIIAESASSRGPSGALRRIAYTWSAFRHARAIDFILAMGSQGVTWYRTCRFPTCKIFPFAYTVETQRINGDSHAVNLNAPFSLIYIGRCVRSKGLQVLLHALSQFQTRNWTLTVVGDGPALAEWKALAAQLGLLANCHWTGSLPNNAAVERLHHADLLLLPAIGKEGWGAVINESLSQGVPVLCSSHCGAADLLNEPWRGQIFEANSPQSLRVALASWLGRGPRTVRDTERIKSWAHCIEGESVAEYFAAVLSHVYDGATRPVAPWLRADSSSEQSVAHHTPVRTMGLRDA